MYWSAAWNRDKKYSVYRIKVKKGEKITVKQQGSNAGQIIFVGELIENN